LKCLEDQHNHPFPKVEKQQRDVTAKKLPVDVKNKHVKVSTKQNEDKTVYKEEKAIDNVYNSTTGHSNSSDVSDNQEYEDDFEVKNTYKQNYVFFLNYTIIFLGLRI